MKFKDIKKELLIGLIAFIFGGVLVVFFQSYIDRPKPQISVKNISFDNNSNDLIDINSNFLNQSDGLVSFNKYMQYQDILKQEQRIGNLLNHLFVLKKELNKWNEDNSSLKTLNLKTFPVFNNIDYNELFIASLKKVHEKNIPINSTELMKLNDEIETGINPKTNTLTVVFDNEEKTIEGLNAYSKNDLTILNNLIYSFRKNQKDNILYFTQNSIKDINERISNYQTMLKDLQNLLIENSRIKLKITIYNNGKDAVVLHPYFKLIVYNEKNIEENYLMNTINWERDEFKPLYDYLSEFKSFMEDDSELITNSNNILGSRDNYKSFFQDKKTYPHLSIPGGGNVTVILEMNSNLDKKGIEIKKWFESGALFCKVNGLTVENDFVQSPEILFNANIQDKIKLKLGISDN